MSERPILTQIAPDALAEMESFHSERVEEVKRAIAKHDVVVVGMALNSACGKAVKALEEAGHKVHYIEIGGYLSKWRERLAIKLWSGWPLYPQVFVKGTLIGGKDRTNAAIADGTVKKLLGKDKKVKGDKAEKTEKSEKSEKTEKAKAKKAEPVESDASAD